LDLPLIALIDITRKRKQILTCTQETTRAKLERLHSARLIHGDQQITTRRGRGKSKVGDGFLDDVQSSGKEGPTNVGGDDRRPPAWSVLPVVSATTGNRDGTRDLATIPCCQTEMGH
jgi:hypothetical protein